MYNMNEKFRKIRKYLYDTFNVLNGTELFLNHPIRYTEGSKYFEIKIGTGDFCIEWTLSDTIVYKSTVVLYKNSKEQQPDDAAVRVYDTWTEMTFNEFQEIYDGDNELFQLSMLYDCKSTVRAMRIIKDVNLFHDGIIAILESDND